MRDYATATDEELLVLARDDADAFAAFYDRHARAVAGWLARRAHPDLAQDLFAETCAQAWCARRRYRPARGSASGWLYGIAQHLLHQSYRRRAVEDRGRRGLGVVVEATSAGTDEAHTRLDAARLRAALNGALAELRPETRDAVLLRVVEQLRYDEIAARLGCTNQTARVRVSRGLRALRRGSPALAAADHDAPAPAAAGRDTAALMSATGGPTP